MTYREQLKLYQEGKLDDETRQEVERAIEKQDAISDYLFAESELVSPPELTEAEGVCGEEDERFTALVRKSVRRTLVKLGVAVGGVVLAVTLFTVFALPHVVDRFYYDPTEVLWENPEKGSPSPQRIQLDLAVWSELFQPGDCRDKAHVEPLGYGKYALTIDGSHSSGNHAYRSRAVSGILTRNKITLYDPNVLGGPAHPSIFLPEEQEYSPEESREMSADFLGDLEEDIWYRTDVSLTEITDYETLYQWCVDRKLMWKDLWFNVYWTPSGSTMGRMGYGFSLNGTSMEIWDQERYPNLLLDYDWHFDEAEVRTHYLSLLAYTKDHPEFTRAMGMWAEDSPQMLDSMMEDVEEHGLRICGFSFVGKKADILPLLEEPSIAYLCATPLE